MRNQFYYQVQQDNKEAAKVLGSFSVDRVIRTVEYEPNRYVILLDDFHEEQGKRQVPKANGRGVTLTNFKETVYSSIYLNEEDSARYKALAEIGEPVPVEQAVA